MPRTLLIEERIRPIIHETYGETPMSEGLIRNLARRIEEYHGDRREHLIMNVCWNWFPGGDTAADAARRIEANLD